ncbi:MAG TPA: hypothetical protein VJS44_15185 [Pyrinomonadaceae bacterium]|nr:hypothetical protein [Pyrinomonadaceae bacterium]
MTTQEGFETMFIRPALWLVPGAAGVEVFQASSSSEEDVPAAGEEDDSLSDAAETERDYVRSRLRDELGREPSEAELDEWLRRHTEGY